MSILLQDRLAALREGANTSVTSDATNPTSLETFVRLCNKAGSECFLDYMKGAKALYKYLSPVQTDVTIFFDGPDPSAVPGLVNAYALDQLTRIVSGETYGPGYMYCRNCIIYYTAKHILEQMAPTEGVAP